MGNPSDWNQVAGSLPGTPQAHLGDLALELKAAEADAIASPLAHFALLQFSGTDAPDFLQGQVTCDVRQVTPGTAQYGGYCSPQGRLLASFLLFLLPRGYLMLLPADLAEAILLRLRKFILRSRVTMELDREMRAIGIGGPNAAGVLAGTVGEPPRRPLELVHYPAASLLRLPGSTFIALAPNTEMVPLWAAVAARARPAGAAAWDWLQIRSGIPAITAATRDQFLPQMVGLDSIGGVSFDKGCYAGQEIVARTHYLGEVKRRLGRGHVDAEARPGDAVLSGGQTRGTVLNAAPSPGGGFDLLAVVQAAAAEEMFRLRTPSGPEARFSLVNAE